MKYKFSVLHLVSIIEIKQILLIFGVSMREIFFSRIKNHIDEYHNLPLLVAIYLQAKNSSCSFCIGREGKRSINGHLDNCQGLGPSCTDTGFTRYVPIHSIRMFVHVFAQLLSIGNPFVSHLFDLCFICGVSFYSKLLLAMSASFFLNLARLLATQAFIRASLLEPFYLFLSCPFLSFNACMNYSSTLRSH